MSKPSCRLAFIVARDAPKALIFRRGPSRWYHLILWRMDSDTFEHGAWFRGRIYVERCDLSPDGTLAVCFCHGGRLRPGYTDSWTVVSRMPWLHALALWPWGTTYGGGGRFADNRSLVLRAGMSVEHHPLHPPIGLDVVNGDVSVNNSTCEVVGVDWCGHDHQGAIVFCRDGKLFRREAQGGDRELADFNQLSPNPQPAPDWARSPLHGA
jgi:hypothetical protein